MLMMISGENDIGDDGGDNNNDDDDVDNGVSDDVDGNAVGMSIGHLLDMVMLQTSIPHNKHQAEIAMYAM